MTTPTFKQRLENEIAAGRDECYHIDLSNFSKLSDLQIKQTAAYTLPIYSLDEDAFLARGLFNTKILIEKLRVISPTALIIAEDTRNDLVDTTKQYVKAVFQQMDFDAAVIEPYGGMETLEPWLQHHGRGLLVKVMSRKSWVSKFFVEENNLTIGEIAAIKCANLNRDDSLGLWAGGYGADIVAVSTRAGTMPMIIDTEGCPGSAIELVRAIRQSRNTLYYKGVV